MNIALNFSALLLLALIASAMGCVQAADTNDLGPTADNFFLCPATGDDANNGRDPANAWATWRKAKAKVRRRGSDLHICAGAVFEDTAPTFAWGGSDEDRGYLGCYYVEDGSAKKCTSEHPRPEFNGTFEAACRANSSCLVNHRKAVPVSARSGGGYRSGLGKIDAGYMTIEHIAFKDSAGHGLTVRSDITDVRMFDIEVGYVAFSGVRMGSRTKRLHLSGSTVHHTVMCDRGQNRAGSPYVHCAQQGAGRGKGHPPHVFMGRDSRGNVVENNDLYSSYGECISASRGSNYAIIIGNRCRDIRSAGILLSESDWTVVESNIFYAPSNPDFGYGVGSIRATSEGRGNDEECDNCVFRNNIHFNANGACSRIGNNKKGMAFGSVMTQKDIGMTCVGARGEYAWRNSVQGKFTKPETGVRGSIIDGSRVRKRACRYKGKPNPGAFAYNLWTDETVNDAVCAGEGDVTGASIALNHASAYTLAEPPAPEAFMPSRADADGVGDSPCFGDRVLDVANYPLWDELTYHSFEASQWEKELGYDATGARRPDSGCDVGAVEYRPSK